MHHFQIYKLDLSIFIRYLEIILIYFEKTVTKKQSLRGKVFKNILAWVEVRLKY